MECRKCKKECLESELVRGVCKECKENRLKTRKFNIFNIIISVILSVIIFFAVFNFVNNNIGLDDFKIERYDLETEKTNYKYSDDTTNYKGTGVITCKDTIYDYIVLVEKKNNTNNEIEYINVIIHNGNGVFNTYDSNYIDTTIKKPNYEFKIIGYRSFKNNR